ncbi:MAG: hypothetical protein JOS17DRAFT_136355 [Linnemannia elongata]|nr:MAG: hypothetical protein JOS17DRAFT_136355 [Linnemannia elongata]
MQSNLVCLAGSSSGTGLFFIWMSSWAGSRCLLVPAAWPGCTHFSTPYNDLRMMSLSHLGTTLSTTRLHKKIFTLLTLPLNPRSLQNRHLPVGHCYLLVIVVCWSLLFVCEGNGR